ncbi:hypothetical protein RFI_30685 [Reticulomyxa filosa]|uniref:Uncharacterized protein n=1 Tax=Reticulomyxa filosa TaxID=46433 RepID=X6LYK2_RETFI|nr:hypothetical protein RFI_30685 [Reticulomyxa filosa]|eukprot:ETO06709.1 hypothetical protein RFI_30685 [Reticulomyxa filosa]
MYCIQNVNVNKMYHLSVYPTNNDTTLTKNTSLIQYSEYVIMAYDEESHILLEEGLRVRIHVEANQYRYLLMNIPASYARSNTSFVTIAFTAYDGYPNAWLSANNMYPSSNNCVASIEYGGKYALTLSLTDPKIQWETPLPADDQQSWQGHIYAAVAGAYGAGLFDVYFLLNNEIIQLSDGVPFHDEMDSGVDTSKYFTYTVEMDGKNSTAVIELNLMLLNGNAELYVNTKHENVYPRYSNSSTYDATTVGQEGGNFLTLTLSRDSSSNGDAALTKTIRIAVVPTTSTCEYILLANDITHGIASSLITINTPYSGTVSSTVYAIYDFVVAPQLNLSNIELFFILNSSVGNGNADLFVNNPSNYPDIPSENSRDYSSISNNADGIDSVYISSANLIKAVQADVDHNQHIFRLAVRASVTSSYVLTVFENDARLLNKDTNLVPQKWIDCKLGEYMSRYFIFEYSPTTAGTLSFVADLWFGGVQLFVGWNTRPDFGASNGQWTATSTPSNPIAEVTISSAKAGTYYIEVYARMTSEFNITVLENWEDSQLQLNKSIVVTNLTSPSVRYHVFSPSIDVSVIQNDDDVRVALRKSVTIHLGVSSGHALCRILINDHITTPTDNNYDYAMSIAYQANSGMIADSLTITLDHLCSLVKNQGTGYQYKYSARCQNINIGISPVTHVLCPFFFFYMYIYVCICTYMYCVWMDTLV